jgi:hypothetical protein
MKSMKNDNEQRRIVAYLDGLPPIGDLRQAKVNALRGVTVHERGGVVCADAEYP